MTASNVEHKEFTDQVAARLRANISKPSATKKSAAPQKQGFFTQNGKIMLLIEMIPCYAVSSLNLVLCSEHVRYLT